MKLLYSTLKGVAGALALAVLLALTGTARAQSVSLAWDTDQSPSTVGYYLYLGTSSGNYTSQIDVGTNTVVTLSGLTPGTLEYFVVRAYTAARLLSPPSNQAVVTVPTLSLTPQMAVVSPASGVPGTQVSVYGLNLSTTTRVQFGGVTAPFTVISANELTTTVPPGAVSGTLAITTSAGLVNGQFTVLVAPPPPTIILPMRRSSSAARR